MGSSGSKSVSKLAVPDIDSMPASMTPKAIDDLVARIAEQRITFGFRKVDPDSRGQEIIKCVAKAMSFLPGYGIRIEGHSNLAKSERKLTSEDRSRIQKLSENRAEACACLLQAAGVENEINCVGQGALKGEKKGCVRLVLFQKWHPSPRGSNEHVTAGVAVDTAIRSVTVKDPFTAETQDTGDQTLRDKSGIQEGPKSSDAEETDGPDQSSALIEPILNPRDVEVKAVEPASTEDVPSKDVDVKVVEPSSTEKVPSREMNSFSVVVEPEDANKKVKGDVATSAPLGISPQAEQWGTTHIPWFIACCTQSTKPKTDECPMQGLPVKQMHLLQ